MVWHPADGHSRIEHHGSHAVAPGHVFSPAFGNTPGNCRKCVCNGDRVRVIPFHGHNEEIAGGHCRPEPGDSGFRDDNDHRSVVLRRDPGKGPPGVSRRGDHRDLPAGLCKPLHGGKRFELLERTGGKGRPLFGPVSRERNEQSGEAEFPGKTGAPVGDRSPGGEKGAAHGKPAEVPEDPGAGCEAQPARPVLGPQQGIVAVRTGLGSGIGDDLSPAHAPQPVPGGHDALPDRIRMSSTLTWMPSFFFKTMFTTPVWARSIMQAPGRKGCRHPNAGGCRITSAMPSNAWTW